MVIYIDDILTAGINEQEHLQILDEVLKRLSATRFQVKRKYFFMMSSVYIFPWISNRFRGLHLLPGKVEAIKSIGITSWHIK